jgi:hypothetical protein
MFMKVNVELDGYVSTRFINLSQISEFTPTDIFDNVILIMSSGTMLRLDKESSQKFLSGFRSRRLEDTGGSFVECLTGDNWKHMAEGDEK